MDPRQNPQTPLSPSSFPPLRGFAPFSKPSLHSLLGQEFPVDPTLQLPIFPPGSPLRFRTPAYFNLSDHEHIMLDNLWANKNSPSFKQALESLALFFHNNKMVHVDAQMSSASLRPFSQPSLDAYLHKERQVNSLIIEVEFLKKDREDLKTKIKEQATLIEQSNKMWIAEMEEKWANQRSRFPEEISQVKSLIYKQVLQAEQEQFLLTQVILRSMARGEIQAPASMAFSVSYFHQAQHFGEPACQCSKGFSVIRASIKISCWEDLTIQGILLSVGMLFNYGFLSRLVVDHGQQAEALRPLSWRLSHFLHHLFNTNKCPDGFINLQIQSIPPLFSDVLSSARHEILARPLPNCYAAFEELSHEMVDMANLSNAPIEEQLSIWRNLLLSAATSWNNIHRLVYEEIGIRVYCSDHSARPTIPFGGVFFESAASTEHFQATHALWHLQHIGDYAFNYVSSDTICAGTGSDFDLGDEDDPVIAHNLENLMEG